jgi:hypothetical protein
MPQRALKMAICPICKSTAEEIEPGFFDGKTFRCQKDGEFGVADSVLEMPAYMNATSAGWEVALRRAKNKALPGARPRIRTHHFDPPPQSN